MNLAMRTYVWCVFFLPYSYQTYNRATTKVDGWEKRTRRPQIKVPQEGDRRPPHPFAGLVPVHVYRMVAGEVVKWSIEYHEYDGDKQGGKGGLVQTVYTDRGRADE
jgi:hypothetical protein